MPDGGSLPLVGDAGGAAGHAVRIARRRRHEGRLMEDALPMRPEVKLSGWRGHLTALGLVGCPHPALFHPCPLGMVPLLWERSAPCHCPFVPILVGWPVYLWLPGLRRLGPFPWAPGDGEG